MISLINANALTIPLADESVQCVVTSPPYWGLRDYGLGDGGLGLEPTPEAYVANMVAVFREVWRVLRPDGVLFLNMGDSYWGGGRGGNGPKRSENWQPEYDHPSWNHPVLKPKDLVGIPWRLAFALQADGWWLRSDIIWSKPNPMPESVTDRPTKAHEYLFLLAKAQRYYYDADAICEDSIRAGDIPGGDNSRGVGMFSVSPHAAFNGTVPSRRNRRTVWEIATAPYSGAHFATFPPALVEPCIKAGCPLGGIVFDPFAGSGTTLMVARQLGRSAIGIDLSLPYLREQARERLGLTALDAWVEGRKNGATVSDLPMFKDL